MTLEEQIQKLTAERDAAQADLKAIGECVGGDPLAVRGLVESMDAVIKERDAALKQVAEMRDALEQSNKVLVAASNMHDMIKCSNFIDQFILSRVVSNALYSSDCGKGYHHDDEWKLVVEALKRLAGYAATVRTDRRKVVDGCIMCLQTEDWCQGLIEKIQFAEQAIAHAEKLISQ